MRPLSMLDWQVLWCFKNNMHERLDINNNILLHYSKKIFIAILVLMSSFE